MKDEIIKKLVGKKSAGEKLNLLREELHHLILQETDRKGFFDEICFLGGTALRIVYGLNRYSEDLDFSLSQYYRQKFDLKKMAGTLIKSLAAFGFDCEITRPRIENNVQGCFFSFKNLLTNIDRTFPKQQTLAIKFEVDTVPPKGAVETVSPVVAARLYSIRHYDLPSLFAGKLHAILFRPYTKGRDLYDFLWYTGKAIGVNKKLLENAIKQTQKQKILITEESLQEMLTKRFASIDFAKAKTDVARFLPDSAELELFRKEVFEGAVKLVKLTK